MKVILYDKVSRTNGRCDFGILKSLSNKFDDAAFSVVRDTATVQVLLSANFKTRLPYKYYSPPRRTSTSIWPKARALGIKATVRVERQLAEH